MKTLAFEGSSDDTFGEYGITYEDVDNCGTGDPIQCVISSEEGSLLVVGQYATTHLKTGSCWVIGISMVSEDSEMPGWPIRYSAAENGYSPRLEIDVPNDAELEWFDNGKKAIYE